MENLETEVTKKISVNYSLLNCQKTDNPGLFIFLHGSGERGMTEQELDQMPDIFISKKTRERNMIFAFPVCPENEIWHPDAVVTLTRYLQEKFNVDKKKTYLAGHSMGGRGTWFTACCYPEVFSGIVPISGYSYYLMASKLINTKVWCFHGELDKVVPIRESIVMVQSIREAGGKNVKMTKLSGFDHNSTYFVLQHDDLFSWLDK